MTTKEIISLLLIPIASVIVSIVAIVFSYLNNKISITSRRSEIALLKQIEAFREISEAIISIRQSLQDSVVELTSTSIGFREKIPIDKYWESVNNFSFIIRSLRIFLPDELYEELSKLSTFCILSGDISEPAGAMNFVAEFNKIDKHIMEIMTRYLGIVNSRQ